MITTAISDENLMALADSELGEQEAAALRARIARDPDLAERYAMFVETRALIQEPSPPALNAERDALADRIIALDRSLGPDRPAMRVIAGGAAASSDRRTVRQPSARGRSPWNLPLAAALALALGGVSGYMLALDPSSRGAAPGSGILAMPAAQAALDRALNETPSGGEVAWSGSGLSGRILIVSTQRLDDGTVCREYEVSANQPAEGRIAGASCRRDEIWRTEIAVAPPGSGSAYTPAGATTAVEQYLTNRGSAGPLAPDDERALIERGWRGQRR